MRWFPALSLGIGSYLLFLLLNFPAQQAIGLASKAGLPASLRLDGAQGTLWSGEADSVSYRQIPLGRITWHFSPTRLLLGSLRYDIELRDAGQQLTGSVQTGLGGGYQLNQVKGVLLADRLPPLMQQSQLRLGGKIDLDQVSLSFDEGRLTAAEGQVRWLDALVDSPLKLKVGDLQADLLTEPDGSVKADIRNLPGPTAIKANASLKADGNLNFEASVKPGSDTDPALTSALQAVGHSKPDGSFQLKYVGRL
jgi:general secretion pathway protein N